MQGVDAGEHCTVLLASLQGGWLLLFPRMRGDRRERFLRVELNSPVLRIP